MSCQTVRLTVWQVVVVLSRYHKNFSFSQACWSFGFTYFHMFVRIECFICLFLPELPRLLQLLDRAGQQPTQEPGKFSDILLWNCTIKLSSALSTSTIADDNDSPWTSTTDHAGMACHPPPPPASCAWSPGETLARWLSPRIIGTYILYSVLSLLKIWRFQNAPFFHRVVALLGNCHPSCSRPCNIDFNLQFTFIILKFKWTGMVISLYDNHWLFK